jgi:hypothetical protein
MQSSRVRQVWSRRVIQVRRDNPRNTARFCACATFGPYVEGGPLEAHRHSAASESHDAAWKPAKEILSEKSGKSGKFLPLDAGCDFLCKKVRTKLTKRIKGPRTSVSAGGSVRLNCFMRPNSTYQAGRGWDDMLLQPIPICNQWMVFSRGRAGVRSCRGVKLSKTCQSQEGRTGRTPAPCAIICSLCGPSVSEGIQSGSVVNQFSLTMSSLR